MERLADIALGALFVLTFVEYFALNRFALFGLGITVWRDRYRAFPSGEARSVHNDGGDIFFLESPDRWLFQRRDDAWFFAGLVYKGVIARDGDGASVTVRVPLFPAALFTMGAIVLAVRGDASQPLLGLVAPVLLILYGRMRGKDAAAAMIPTGHA